MGFLVVATHVCIYVLLAEPADGERVVVPSTTLVLWGLKGGGLALFSWAVVALAMYWKSGSVIPRLVGARMAGVDERRVLTNVIEEMAIAAGLAEAKPDFFVLETPALNAFACGRSAYHGSIVVTRGLLDVLDRSELQAVMAHELAHLKNGDVVYAVQALAFVWTLIAVSTGLCGIAPAALLVVLFAGLAIAAFFIFLAFCFVLSCLVGGASGDVGGAAAGFVVIGAAGAAICMVMMVAMYAAVNFLVFLLTALGIRCAASSISQTREYLADAYAAQWSREPGALASALAKIARNSGLARRSEMLALPLLVHSGSVANEGGMIFSLYRFLFRSHPDIRRRIDLLRAMSPSGSDVSTLPSPSSISDHMRRIGEWLFPLAATVAALILAVAYVRFADSGVGIRNAPKATTRGDETESNLPAAAHTPSHAGSPGTQRGVDGDPGMRIPSARPRRRTPFYEDFAAVEPGGLPEGWVSPDDGISVRTDQAVSWIQPRAERRECVDTPPLAVPNTFELEVVATIPHRGALDVTLLGEFGTPSLSTTVHQQGFGGWGFSLTAHGETVHPRRPSAHDELTTTESWNSSYRQTQYSSPFAGRPSEPGLQAMERVRISREGDTARLIFRDKVVLEHLIGSRVFGGLRLGMRGQPPVRIYSVWVDDRSLPGLPATAFTEDFSDIPEGTVPNGWACDRPLSVRRGALTGSGQGLYIAATPVVVFPADDFELETALVLEDFAHCEVHLLGCGTSPDLTVTLHNPGRLGGYGLGMPPGTMPGRFGGYGDYPGFRPARERVTRNVPWQVRMTDGAMESIDGHLTERVVRLVRKGQIYQLWLDQRLGPSYALPRHRNFKQIVFRLDGNSQTRIQRVSVTPCPATEP